MRLPIAIAGSAVFFALVFGVVVVFVPWHFTHWQMGPPLLGFYPFRIVGALLMLAALPVFVDGYVQFALRGLGTPAPVAPPPRLVVSGLYAHVRNPMYVAIVAMTLGQGLIFDDGSALRYPLYLWVGFFLFVYFYEEPVLRRRFGQAYLDYCARVPRWIPRLKAYSPDQ
ncbi:MAG TPA: isoprenylcysteine carboxylmethyltransferase family protein [Gammaproteobacteria bacterium]|nr:isoprenylcysteine carboxylmethyltransferase family protein [Gammaproteobacteria bacterium]